MLESTRGNCNVTAVCGDNQQEIAFQIAMFFCQKGGYDKETATPMFDQNYYLKIISKVLSFKTIPDLIHHRLKDVCLVALSQ